MYDTVELDLKLRQVALRLKDCTMFQQRVLRTNKLCYDWKTAQRFNNECYERTSCATIERLHNASTTSATNEQAVLRLKDCTMFQQRVLRTNKLCYDWKTAQCFNNECYERTSCATIERLHNVWTTSATNEQAVLRFKDCTMFQQRVLRTNKLR